MRRLSLLPILLVVALAAPATAPAAIAPPPPPLQADFTFAPADPEPGETITFTDASTGAGTVHGTEWDLDGDGEFDDGRLPAVQRAFPAGAHTVRLKVTRSGPVVQADVAEKTFTVAAPSTSTTPTTPTPTTQPPPVTETTPTTETAPPPAGATNQAPTARINEQCAALAGKQQLCLAKYAKPHTAKTFTSSSRDVDGQIVRHEWDLDGNGTFERDTGSDPQATTTYGDMNPVTIHLRVTDDRGATAETALQLVKTEPACETRAAHELVSATSPCFRRDHFEAGDGKTLMADGRLRSGAGVSGDRYRSKDPILLNGIGITPGAGKEVVVRIIDWGDGKGTRVDVYGPGATAVIRRGGDVVTIDEGGLHWRVVGDRLTDVVVPAGSKLGGLDVVALSEAPKLVLGAGARWAFTVRMPQQFGAPTSDKPIVFTNGGAQALAASRRAQAHAADAPLHFEVEHAALGPIGLDKLALDYDGDGFWQIEADVTLPPPVDASVEAKAGILNGAFNYAGADVRFNNQGLNIIGPVFLKRIKFRVEVSPKVSECVPHVGKVKNPRAGGIGGAVVTAPGMPPEPEYLDYGVPTFALCGEVGMVVGPTIAGTSAIALDGGLGFATYDDRPSVFRAFGDVALVGIPLYEAALELHTDGYLEAEARAKWVWPGTAIVHGEIGLEMLGTQFNAHGRVEACLEFVDWCAVGARAVASNKGVAVCLRVDFEADTWEPGIGYRWGETPTLYFAGCQLGPYKNRIEHAAIGDPEQTIALDAGLPGAAIALEGRDGPPRVTLVGPKGERFTVADGLMPQRDGRFFVLKDPKAKLTQIAIAKPSGGAWRILTEEGSTQVQHVKVADGLARPQIRAKVVGTDHRRAIEYRIEQRPGLKVSFAERGASTGGLIGTAKGATGRLRFSPADGKAEPRTIVAIVEQDGMPADQISVGSYRAPSPARPAAPKRVRIARRGSSVRVSWAKGAAPAHVVAVALGGGRRVVQRVDGRTALMIRGAGRRTSATATVRAVGRNGMLGAGRKARLAAPKHRR